MADTSTATENAAAADEAAELERLRAQLAEVRRQRDVDGQTCAEAVEMADDLLERLREAHDLLGEWQDGASGELSDRTRAHLKHRRARRLAEVDADIVSVVRARYRAGHLAWLGERLSGLCREVTLPRSEHRYGPCSADASPPASPAGAAYRAAVDAAAAVEDDPPDPDPCGCEQSEAQLDEIAALQLKISTAVAHLVHPHCPQNNVYVRAAIEVLRG